MAGDLFDSCAAWLLALCGPHPRERGFVDVAAVAKSHDIPSLDDLWALARREKLGPLFAWHADAPLRWPDGLQAALPAWLQRHGAELKAAQKAQRKIAMAREVMLLRLDALLAECGTTALLYKGSAYEQQLYPAPGLRPMTDVDILVPQSEYATVQRVLQEADFQVIQTSSNEQCLRDGHTGIYVDLHNDVSTMDEGLIDVAGLFAKGTPIAPGSALHTLPLPEALLLHLHHMRSHGMESGHVWLLHFAELGLLWSQIQAEGSWDALLQLAEAWRLKHLLVLGVICLEAMACTAPLPDVAELMTHRGPLAMAQREALRWLLLHMVRLPPVVNLGPGHPPASRLEAARRKALRYSLRLLSHDGLRDVARSHRRYIEALTPG